jgi:hypothetical protein
VPRLMSWMSVCPAMMISGLLIRFQAAHRSQPPLQLPVVCFDPVVGVGLHTVPGTGLAHREHVG